MRRAYTVLMPVVAAAALLGPGAAGTAAASTGAPTGTNVSASTLSIAGPFKTLSSCNYWRSYYIKEGIGSWVGPCVKFTTNEWYFNYS